MKFTYTGEDVRDYPNVDGKSLRCVPGETYDLKAAPDSRFIAQSAPVAPVTPEPGA